jgi:DNA-binding XRE family transcriptional regulator
MQSTWDRQTMRFAKVEYISRQDVLDVTFENGDRFVVALESVLIPSSPIVDWSRVRIGETRDVLEIPDADELIEIPWDRIRAVADPAFRAHLADHARERARFLGARIRALRQEAGLSRAELAEKAGVDREALAEMEAGKKQASVDAIEHIALALGKRLREFSAE